MSFIKCTSGEFFCHVFIVFILGIYIGYAFNTSDEVVSKISTLQQQVNAQSTEYDIFKLQFQDLIHKIEKDDSLFRNFYDNFEDKQCLIVLNENLKNELYFLIILIHK